MKTLIALTTFALAAAGLAPDWYLVTSTERRHRTAESRESGWSELVHTGGWGPHLRPLMRTDRGVWFAVDEAASLTANLRTAFYRYDGERWSLAGQQEHLPGIQQNCARVYVEPHVWSYGIAPEKKGARLMEAWYRTSANAKDAGARWVEIDGKPLILPESSNYVGAAVAPGGGRVVWWTVVGDQCKNRTGQWSYIYQAAPGTRWTGPVTAPLSTGPHMWDALGYVHVAFKDAHTVSLIGQLATSRCPASSFRAAVAEFAVGATPFFTPLAFPDTTQSSSGDIWVDRRTGDAHVLTRSASDGRVAYYYKPGGEPWGGEPLPFTIFDRSYRSRFTVDAPDGRLYFIKGGVAATDAVEVRGVDIPSIRGAVDWNAVAPRLPRLPRDGFGSPAAIYVQREDQQSTVCEGLFFALCGSPMANPLPHDNLIIHVNP